jgi:hypothetical protein
VRENKEEEEQVRRKKKLQRCSLYPTGLIFLSSPETSHQVSKLRRSVRPRVCSGSLRQLLFQTSPSLSFYPILPASLLRLSPCLSFCLLHSAHTPFRFSVCPLRFPCFLSLVYPSVPPRALEARCTRTPAHTRAHPRTRTPTRVGEGQRRDKRRRTWQRGGRKNLRECH